MIKTLLLATAAVTAIAAAAPAFARERHGHYYGYYRGYGYFRGYDISGPGGTAPPYAAYRVPRSAIYGYVPYNYGSYCGQLPKAC